MECDPNSNKVIAPKIKIPKLNLTDGILNTDDKDLVLTPNTPPHDNPVEILKNKLKNSYSSPRNMSQTL